ncbi:hypothetical protein LIER_07620 [Lithospermum erythrorhizon]|uniref:Uncharacterized protein n=1 Tax=Lithospermum erythrorhizon TaxID=34254 RepID=A0AAV3P9U8_LITER
MVFSFLTELDGSAFLSHGVTEAVPRTPQGGGSGVGASGLTSPGSRGQSPPLGARFAGPGPEEGRRGEGCRLPGLSCCSPRDRGPTRRLLSRLPPPVPPHWCRCPIRLRPELSGPSSNAPYSGYGVQAAVPGRMAGQHNSIAPNY